MVYNALNTKRSFDLLQVIVFCVHRMVRFVVFVDLLRVNQGRKTKTE